MDKPMSIRNALQHHFDMLCPPSKAVVAHLSARLRSRGQLRESKRLSDLFEDDDKWNSFVHQEANTMANLFVSLHSDCLTFEDWLQVWPAMRYRLYSIASAPASSQDTTSSIRVLISVVDKGQLSGFMSKPPTAPGTQIAAKIRRSNFRLPEDQQSDIVMVAAGTGLAPFLSFLEERRREEKQSESLLFHGCRGDHNFLCRDQLRDYTEAGVLDKVIRGTVKEKACC